MKRLLALALALVLTVALMAGCGNNTAPSTSGSGSGDVSGSGSASGEAKKIALVVDKVGTNVFLISMVNALNDAAKEYNFEPIIVECADGPAFEENMRALAEEGVDLIIGGAWQAGEAINKVASELPDACDYALIDAEVETPIVKCISYREQEGAYLIGMIAAMVTEDAETIFGGVHVNQGAGSWKWRYGFMEGAKAVKPTATFVFNYTGSFSDAPKAKEFALQQYAQGARFINGAAAGGDSGVFEAAMEKGFYTSGQDVDLTTPDNKYIVTSQIKDTYATVMYLVEQYFSGAEWSGDDEVWGVKEGTIGAVHATHESTNPRSDRLTEEDVALLKQAAKDIADGKLMAEIPAEETYK